MQTGNTSGHQTANSQNSFAKPKVDEPLFPCPHGTKVRKGHDGELLLWECSKCEEERKKKDEDAKKRVARQKNFSQLWTKYNEYMRTPRRFVGKTLDNYVADSREKQKALNICQRYVNSREQILENGTCLVFCGKPGTGKTHLAYAMMTELHKHTCTCAIVNASDMTASVKNAYKSDYKDVTPQTEVKGFSELEFLIIDEVGVQVESDSEKRIFFDIMNKRYSGMRPTVIISNLEFDELTKFVGERVIDRMRENNGVIIPFTWESHRTGNPLLGNSQKNK